jgi:hypothetical protein
MQNGSFTKIKTAASAPPDEGDGVKEGLSITVTVM